ncbi:hypothetical protein VIRA109638_10780 [Vibrio rarus]
MSKVTQSILCNLPQTIMFIRNYQISAIAHQSFYESREKVRYCRRTYKQKPKHRSAWVAI